MNTNVTIVEHAAPIMQGFVFPVDIENALAPNSDVAKRIIAAEKIGTADAAARRKQGLLRNLQQGRNEVYDLCPFRIKVKPGFNCRDFNDPGVQAHVMDIAQDIAKNGFDRSKPLVIHTEGDTIYLDDGECRLRAVMIAINVLGAEIMTVPVINDRGKSDAERIAAQKRHNSGRGFTPLEDAKLVTKLESFGWTAERIQDATGISIARQRQLREVAEMPEAVQQKVREGLVSATQAVALVRENSGDANAVVRQIESAVQASKARGGKGRATARALAEAGVRRPSLKKAILTVLNDQRVSIDNAGRGNVTIIMPRDLWHALNAALGGLDGYEGEED